MADPRINLNFSRPDTELIERFRDIPVANIDDAMDRMQATDSGIVPIGKGKLLGTAFTVKVAQGDNLMLHAAMDLAEPGDVIVIDAGGFESRAIFGGLMSLYCKIRGIRGMVCDGAIRDREELSMMEGFPVYARTATPDGPYKNGPGEIGTPVVIGGRIVHPGDIVIGDGDGIIFLDPALAKEIIDSVEKIKRKEEEIKRGIVEKHEYIRPWVKEKLSELGYDTECL